MNGIPTITPVGGDFIWFYLGLAGLGALGGVIAEVLQVIRGGRGLIELPHKSGTHRIDIGILANVLVGAIAACAATYLFPPTSYVVGEGAAEVTKVGYPVYTLIPLALILGIAGSAVLSAATSKALAATNAQTAVNTQSAATAALASIKSKATDPHGDATALLAEVAAAADSSIRTIRAIGNSPGDESGA